MGEVHDLFEARMRKWNARSPEEEQRDQDASRIVTLTYLLRFPESGRYEQEFRAELEDLKRKYGLTGEEEWIDAAVEAEKQRSDNFEKRIQEANEQRERESRDPNILANRAIAVEFILQAYRLIDNGASSEAIDEALAREREAFSVLPIHQRVLARQLATEIREQEITKEE